MESSKSEINNLFSQAVKHYIDHDCSAPPYENGEKLLEYVERFQPKEILEIGTGMGYTAVLLTKFSSNSKIDTLEKDSEHVFEAKNFCFQNGVGNRVNIIESTAEDFFPTITKKYDFIFFDGYQIHYEFLAHYSRLLKPGGILFLANNHLKSRTSDSFFTELNSSSQWKILELFADTTVAQRI